MSAETLVRPAPAAEEDEAETDDEDNYTTHEPVQGLSTQGVNQSEINKLVDAGITTLGQILQKTSKDLQNIKGFSEAKIEKVRLAARKLLHREENGGVVFKSGLEVEMQRQNVLKITTGAKGLDALLGGGIHSREITQVYGEFRTGKTQLMHTLCVTTQTPIPDGGGEGKVLIIDTEGNFRTERVRQIAEQRGLDPDGVLENVTHTRPQTSEEQCDAVRAAASLFAEQGPYRLMVVDSLTALFRVEYQGRGELADRQQKLGKHMHDLIKLVEEFNVALLVTNQAQAVVDGMSLGPSVKAIGGHIMSHYSTTIVWFKKHKDNLRVAKLQDSPYLAEGEAQFQLDAKGVSDPD